MRSLLSTTPIVLTLALLGALQPGAARAQDQPAGDDRLARQEERVAHLLERLERAERQLEWHRRVLGIPGPGGPGSAAQPLHLVPAASTPLVAEAVSEAPAAEVNASLIWLRAHQEPDGHWSSPDRRHDVAVTALSVLAFLGSGHTHRFGDHKRTVDRALDWLRDPQSPAGMVWFASDASLALLDQALATRALVEAYAVSRDFTIKRPASQAVRSLLSLQTEGGGWGFFTGPGSAPNTLATVHAVAALRAARTAGLEVPDEAFAAALNFLARVTDAQGLVGFSEAGDGVSLTLGDPAAAPRVPWFTAGAVVARLLCGQDRADEAVKASGQQLVLPDRRWAAPGYTYWGTAAAYHLGGAQWTAWSRAVRATLLSTRVTGDEQQGAWWEPTGLWGALGGRAGVTALNTLTLQFPRRFARSYRRAEAPEQAPDQGEQ